MLHKINHRDLPWKGLPKVFQKIYKAARNWRGPDTLLKFIYFDPLPRYEGSRHLPFFLDAIEYARRVEFEYQAYHAAAPKTVVFDPWFLRHYDRRWYVGGFSHDPSERFVRTFPLERLRGEPKAAGFFHDKPPDYDAASYWRHIFGITVPRDRTLEHVTLEFSYLQGRYFVDTPFFEPYELLEQGAGKYVIRFQIIPNIDLKRKLASLGDEVRVLAPAWLAAEMREFHHKALEEMDR
jgi:predicted DNA-binding transcriptional regulator YafY